MINMDELKRLIKSGFLDPELDDILFLIARRKEEQVKS